MGIFVTKASPILCYGYNNQIDDNQRKAYETVFHQKRVLENVEHCGGEPEQAASMATCT